MPDEEPRIPAPPRSEPPLPPYVPLTPMMSFLERRLESLEGDLAVERERAQAAQNLLQQQESIRQEVETHLKSLTEQLRREKLERESEENKAHARGRVDALEKRLDEMHQSWLSLIKESLSQREAQSQEQAALKAEIAGALALAKEKSSLKEHLDWGQELTSLDRRFTELKAELARSLSSVEKRLEELAERLAQPPAPAQPKDELIASLQAEKGALLKELETRLREQQRQALDSSAAALMRAQLAAMARQLDSMLQGADPEREKLLRLLKEKDETIALLRAAFGRGQA